jgi:hypothetical protein
MIKYRLIKTAAFGLCMSAFFTGAAFAQSGGGSEPSFTGQAIAGQTTPAQMSETDKALYDKQLEIDRYLFADHVKEIEEKGIKAVYTVVTDNCVEIGVAGLTDENANYLYELFGKENVKVVAAEEAQVYTTMVDPMAAPDAVDGQGAAVSGPKETNPIYTTQSAETTAAVDDSAPVSDGRVYKGNATSGTGSEEAAGDLENPDAIFYTTADGVAAPGQEAELVSTAVGAADAVKRGTESDDKGMNVPMTILAIAGGAAVIGGAVIISAKKKEER